MAKLRQHDIAIASGAATGSTDLGYDGFERVYLNNEAGGEIAIEISGDGSTYAPMKYASAADAGVWVTAVVGSAHSGSFVELPSVPRYFQVVATGAAADGATVTVLTA